MRRLGWYLFVRLVAIVSIVGATLIAPQQLAWGAPQTRTHHIDIEPGETAELPFPATHVAVMWEGEGTAVVQVRGGRSLSGEWSSWRTAASDDLEMSGEQSGMALVDDAVELQVRVLSGSARDIRLMAIDTVHGPRSLELQPAGKKAEALNGYTGQPPITSRSQWGADESLRKGTPEFAPISKIIVHHTVTDNADPDPAATVRAIYAFHTGGNGWNDIGYNFLIDQNGKIYEGRYARDYGGAAPTGEDINKKGVIGAHALDHNTGSVGIALLGDFTAASPTNAQLASLEQLIAWKADRHNLDIMAPGVVVGHRDVNQTSCPGGVAYGKLSDVRANANAIKTLAYPPGNTPGYWIAGRDGSVQAYGVAGNYGSMAGQRLNGQIASMTRTASGGGYWLMGSDGGIFTFGDAQFHGSMGGRPLNQPVVGLAPTPDGGGYWLVASDGGIFAFGNARFFGSMGGERLNKPMVGIAPTPSGNGYWTVASDGGIFAFGDAAFYGSTGSLKLNQPVMTMSARPDGDGYWLMAKDGGVFAFGSAPFRGSVPMLRLSSFAGAVQAVSTETGMGYYMLASDGGVYSFGDARFWGAAGGKQVAGMALVPEP